MFSERRFEQKGIKTGTDFAAEITRITPETYSESSDFKGSIKDIRGGGFYGKTLIFEDSVIKTGKPDSWHEFWRNLNWGKPFPPQAFETAAILDHLSTTIINKTMPLKNILTPKSLGYTDLGELGFGQAIERMFGTIPQFDEGGKENMAIENARRQIWELGKQMGIESAAQVHPDNPFGKPNLWLGENDVIIWLDLLPAIRHTYFVYPFFRYPFHKDVNKHLKRFSTTFNKIHSNKMRDFIIKNPSLFSSTKKEEVFWYLNTYDEFYADYEYLSELDYESAKEFTKVQASSWQRLAYESAIDFISNAPIANLAFDPEKRSDLVRFILNRNFRNKTVIEGSLLRGAKQAYENGLISEEKFIELLDRATEGDLKYYAEMQIFYALMTRATDVLAGMLATPALFINDPILQEQFLNAALKTFLFLPSAIKVVSAAIVHTMKKADMRIVMLSSWLPAAGTYLSVPLQAAYSSSKNEELWHYTKRWMVSLLSKILSPASGGIGTDKEEKLWKALKLQGK